MDTMEINPIERASEVLEDGLKAGISYEDYRKLVNSLANENSNSGPEKTEALANFTQLNDRRMKRWDKTLKISEEFQQKLKGLDTKLTWLVLTESWCGDAASIIPVMNKVAALAPNLELKIVFRDEHPALMDQFLTNGTRSIPKLIALEASSKRVLGEWGPRTAKATQMVEDCKAAHGRVTPEFKEELQGFYNKDKGQDILMELLDLLALE